VFGLFAVASGTADPGSQSLRAFHGYRGSVPRSQEQEHSGRPKLGPACPDRSRSVRGPVSRLQTSRSLQLLFESIDHCRESSHLETVGEQRKPVNSQIDILCPAVLVASLLLDVDPPEPLNRLARRREGVAINPVEQESTRSPRSSARGNAFQCRPFCSRTRPPCCLKENGTSALRQQSLMSRTRSALPSFHQTRGGPLEVSPSRSRRCPRCMGLS